MFSSFLLQVVLWFVTGLVPIWLWLLYIVSCQECLPCRHSPFAGRRRRFRGLHNDYGRDACQLYVVICCCAGGQVASQMLPFFAQSADSVEDMRAFFETIEIDAVDAWTLFASLLHLTDHQTLTEP